MNIRRAKRLSQLKYSATGELSQASAIIQGLYTQLMTAFESLNTTAKNFQIVKAATEQGMLTLQQLQNISSTQQTAAPTAPTGAAPSQPGIMPEGGV